MRGNRTEASVLANRRNRWIVFHGHKTHVVKFERLKIDRFLNQIAVLVADVLEFRRRAREHRGCGPRHDYTVWV